MFPRALKSKNKFPARLFLCLIFVASFGLACEPSPSMMNSNDVAPPSDVAQTNNNLTSLEREIRDMKNVDFKFIYVFKRKDGAAFTAEDKQFMRDNRPAEINRFSGADDGKAFVAGSNFDFPPENMENLQKRFAVEIIAKPEPTPTPQPANNTNQTQNK